MQLEFIIATTNRKEATFLHDMFAAVGIDRIHAVVINQLTHPNAPLVEIDPPHAGIRIFSVREAGLAKSRNLGLRHSRGDVLVLADDDVVYGTQALDIIAQCHLDQPDKEILTFSMRGGETGVKYTSLPYCHTIRTAWSVASCEITLKRSLLDKEIHFDERFGLGALYPIAEENIWLCDAIRAGVNAGCVPPIIVGHEGQSTGQLDSLIVQWARGAAYTRIYGLLAFPLCVWIAIKKQRQPHRSRSFFRELALLLRGALHFLFASKRSVAVTTRIKATAITVERPKSAPLR